MVQKIIKKCTSLIFGTIRTAVVIVLTIIIAITIPTATAGVFLIFAPIRACVALLARKFRPDLDSLVTNEHSLFTTRTDGLAPSNILITITLEGEPSLENLRRIFDTRIFNLRDGENFVYDKLWKTWESFMGYSFWKIDPEFDVKNHLRDYDYAKDLALPNPCRESDLQKVAGKLINAPWDRSRSPWEFLRIKNFESMDANSSKNSEDNSGEKLKTVMLLRLDHLLGDGYSFMELARIYFDADFQFPTLKLGDTTNLSIWKKLGIYLSVPYHTADNILLAFTAWKFQFLNKLLKRESTIVISPFVDVESVKRIKKHFNVHYASVVYAAILGAIHRVITFSGQKSPNSLVSLFVVPKPNHPKGLTIHAALLLAEWPVNCCSRVERLKNIQKNFVSISRSTAALAYILTANLAAYVPIFLRKFGVTICLKTGISLGCTVFPVTQNEHFFEGGRICDVNFGAGATLSFGLIASAGGVSNRQRFNFVVQKGMFASEEEIQKLGIYAVEEIHYLLEETL